MTKIELPEDLLRKRIEELSQKASSHFRTALLPIYGSNDNDSPIHIGTSIAICVDKIRYLLTAAHIIDENENTSLYIGHKAPILLQGDFQATTKPDGDRKKDHFDFAYLKLSPEVLHALDGVKFISEAELDINNEFQNGDSYTAIGFPNSKNKFVGNSKKPILSKLISFSGPAKQDTELTKKLVITGNEHVFVGFNEKYARDSGGNRVSSTSPIGLSGGALISLGRLSDPLVIAGCAEPIPTLSGLLTTFKRDHEVIIATRIGVIHETIRNRSRSTA